jgi:hypothetical protein
LEWSIWYWTYFLLFETRVGRNQILIKFSNKLFKIQSCENIMKSHFIVHFSDVSIDFFLIHVMLSDELFENTIQKLYSIINWKIRVFVLKFVYQPRKLIFFFLFGFQLFFRLCLMSLFFVVKNWRFFIGYFIYFSVSARFFFKVDIFIRFFLRVFLNFLLICGRQLQKISLDSISDWFQRFSQFNLQFFSDCGVSFILFFIFQFF